LEEDDYVPYVPLKQRRLEKLHKYANQRRFNTDPEDPVSDDNDEILAGPKANVSLLDQTVQQKLTNAIPGTLQNVAHIISH
jgi:ATP-dependent RNA helicase DDX41